MSVSKACGFATVTLSPAVDCTIRVTGPLALGGVVRACGETRVPGGKGLNVAKQLAACGSPACVAGLLGQDVADDYRRYCAERGIAFAFVTVAHATRANLMITDGSRELKVNRAAFPELAFSDSLLNRCIDAVAAADIVVVSGSLPEQWPVSTYPSLVQRLKARGKRVVVDTSGPALAAAVGAQPDMIKPNREECEALVGEPLPDDRAIQRVLRSLAATGMTVVLSDGARGAWFAHDGHLLFCAAPAVQTVDTTAAGDVMLGEFCHHFFAAGTLTPEAAAHAVAAGSAAVELAGSHVPPRHRIEQLLARMRVDAHA